MSITPPLNAPDVEAPAQPRRMAPRAVAITATALGAAIVLATAGTAAASTLASSSTSTSTRVLDVANVDGLRIDVSASQMQVRFADVADAQLDVTGAGGADRWTFERHDDELVVASPRWVFGIGWLFSGDTRVVLTLPQSMQSAGLDASFSLAAGDLDVEGDFADLEIDLGAGSLQLAGSAEDLSAEVSAGRADLDLRGVQEADLTVSAGDLVGQLTGSAPENISIDLSAGSIRLTLPDEDYDVQVGVSAGGIDNTLATSTSAPRRITGGVSAGTLVLRPGN